MTKALVTVRSGASLTAIHDAALAAAWIRELSATLLTKPLQDQVTRTPQVWTHSLPIKVAAIINALLLRRVKDGKIESTVQI